MKTSEQLIIPFKGLADGKHEFEFQLTDNFFKSLDYSEFEKGEVEVKIELDKKPTHMVFFYEINGQVNVMCDRCLDKFDMEVDFESEQIVKLGDNEEDSTDEIMIISPNEYELNITHYIYESICLSLPANRYHTGKGKNGCNKDMLKKIKELQVSHVESEIDPRWEKLKNLNNN